MAISLERPHSNGSFEIGRAACGNKAHYSAEVWLVSSNDDRRDVGDPIPAFSSQTLSVCATFVRPCTWPLPVVAGGVSCDDSMRIVKSPEEFAAGAVWDAA